MSAVLLLPSAARAAELEPFFAVKASSINTFVTIAEGVASMAGAANEPGFQMALAAVREIRGFNFNGDFGIAIAVTEGDTLSPILLLPITDLANAHIPASPEVFESIRPFLMRRNAERTDIVTPFGTYAALQRQGFLVVVPENIVASLPADPRTLFADIQRYTIGVKLDLTKVEFETIENLFAPVMLMVMMTAPEMVEQLEEMIEMYRALYNEVSAISYGIAVNTQNADVEFSMTMAARAGSDTARAFADYRPQPTRFGGFRGVPANNVFSFGYSATGTALPNNNPQMELARQQWETILEGALEQINMDDETGETGKMAQEAFDTIFAIMDATTARGAGDYAASFNTDGTLLLAFDTVSLADIRNLSLLIYAFARDRMPAGAEDLLDASLGFTNIEGFTVSSFRLPIVPILEVFQGPAPDDIPEVFNALALNGYWAVRDGDTQAIALAVGLDAAKTEQAFRTALQQTRTAVPVQRPMSVASVQGLGRYFQQTIIPIMARALEQEPDETVEEVFEQFKRVAALLASAGDDAVITMDSTQTPNSITANGRISGRAIQTIIAAARLMLEPHLVERPAMRDF